MPIDPIRAARRRAAAVSLLLALLVFAPPAPGGPQGEPEPPPEESPAPAEPLAEGAAATEDQAAAQETAPDEEPPSTPAEPPPPPPPSDLELAQATMGHILHAGHALHSWVRDTRLERDRRPPTGRAPGEVDWDRCPPISHADLAALLVPAYLRELPENDAWGRPLEFCLDQRLSASFHQYGVRSAGADGDYESGDYLLHGFAETDLDSDLVWMDNHFVRWPAAE